MEYYRNHSIVIHQTKKQKYTIMKKLFKITLLLLAAFAFTFTAKAQDPSSKGAIGYITDTSSHPKSPKIVAYLSSGDTILLFWTGKKYKAVFSGGSVGPTYKVYTAKLTQSSTSDPTATVISNTTGLTIAWTRSATGTYVGTFSTSQTNLNKITIQGNNNISASAITSIPLIQWSYNLVSGHYNAGIVTKILNVSAPSLTATDGVLTDTFVEIRVYN